jgi:hypothetical protein
MTTEQRVEQSSRDRKSNPVHTHPETVHSHDHYHITHHHSGGMLGEWDHRTSWHTHNHNHNQFTHAHDFDTNDEEAEHAKESHVHDHSSPADSPA